VIVGVTSTQEGLMSTTGARRHAESATADSARRIAVRNRDVARSKVRWLTVGVMAASVGVASFGAVALAAPATPAATSASTSAVAATKSGPAVTAGAPKQAPVAATGGS